MRIAVAADSPDLNINVSMHGARAAFYLIFDDAGNLAEQVENPFTSIERGAGPRTAKFLADKGVNTVIAGEFGGRFAMGLEDRGIKIIKAAGIISDVTKEMIE